MSSVAGFSLRGRDGTEPHLWSFTVFSYESGSAITLLLANLIVTKHYKRVNRTSDRLFNKQERTLTICISASFDNLIAVESSYRYFYLISRMFRARQQT